MRFILLFILLLGCSPKEYKYQAYATSGKLKKVFTLGEADTIDECVVKANRFLNFSNKEIWDGYSCCVGCYKELVQAMRQWDEIQQAKEPVEILGPN